MKGLHAPPKGPWAAVWILGPLLAVVVLGAVELFFRAQGHAAGMTSREDLWCHHRQRVEGAGPKTVALLGSSRMQMGLLQPTFREELPAYEPVQLAVAGTGPTATLRDLAGDESFSGVVLCAVTGRTLQPMRQVDQEPLVRYYRTQWGPGKDLGLLVSTPFQLRLVLLQPHLSLRLVVSALLRDELPGVNYVTTKFDRTRVPDYSKVDLDRVVQRRMTRIRAELEREPPVGPQEWLEIVDRLAGHAAAIEARGGRVVFVRFPSRGRYQELEDELFPRERYWDVFAERVGVETLHYSEMPGDESLILPDESHLDQASAVRFTRWIADELLARGVVTGG